MDRDEVIGKVGTGKVFGITFIKSDGRTRRMAARLAVESKSGADRNATHPDPQLLTVFDMNSHDFRSIRLETVLQIKVGGKVIYEREPDEPSSSPGQLPKGDNPG